GRLGSAGSLLLGGGFLGLLGADVLALVLLVLRLLLDARHSHAGDQDLGVGDQLGPLREVSVTGEQLAAALGLVDVDLELPGPGGSPRAPAGRTGSRPRTAARSPSTLSPLRTLIRSAWVRVRLRGWRWLPLLRARCSVPSEIASASSALGLRAASALSWPGSSRWTGSLPCSYRTAGTLPPARIRRAAPLPNSWRSSTVSFSAMRCSSWW